MERNAGYEIKRLLLYDDNKGFALGENLRAPDPYVTWKVADCLLYTSPSPRD